MPDCQLCGKHFDRSYDLLRHRQGDKWRKPSCKGVKKDDVVTPDVTHPVTATAKSAIRQTAPAPATPSTPAPTESIPTDKDINALPNTDDAASFDAYEAKQAEETEHPAQPVSAEEMRRIRLNERLTKFMSAIFSGPMKQIGSALRTKTERAPLSKERQALIDDLGEITQELFGLEFDIKPKVWKIEGFFTAVLAICGIYISLIFFPETGEVLKTKPPAEKKEPEKPRNVTPMPSPAKTEKTEAPKPKDGAWNNFGKDKGEL